MSNLAWVFIVIAAVAVAFVAGRFAAPRSARLRALQQERDAAAAELRRYREEVSAHFEKTATLFNQVTGAYRGLYEHLAEGSRRLGLGPDAHLLQTQPEQRKLEAQPSSEPSEAAAAADSASEGEPAYARVGSRPQEVAESPSGPVAQGEGKEVSDAQSTQADEAGPRQPAAAVEPSAARMAQGDGQEMPDSAQAARPSAAEQGERPQTKPAQDGDEPQPPRDFAASETEQERRERMH